MKKGWYVNVRRVTNGARWHFFNGKSNVSVCRRQTVNFDLALRPQPGWKCYYCNMWVLRDEFSKAALGG